MVMKYTKKKLKTNFPEDKIIYNKIDAAGYLGTSLHYINLMIEGGGLKLIEGTKHLISVAELKKFSECDNNGIV